MGRRMGFHFFGHAKMQSTGDFRILAYVGDMSVQCIVERGAITAGFAGLYTSDTEMLQLFAARKPEIELIASQRFFNGERPPVVKRRHMLT
jgi:hypothetical protein